MSREFDDALTRARLEALAEFAAGAGHEINNPLATILGRTELLLRRASKIAPSGEVAEATRDLNIIAGQVQRIRDMIGDLMLFARPPAPKFESVVLADAVRSVIRSLSTQAATLGIELEADLADGGSILADSTQVSVVVAELVRNALNATPRGGRIRVGVRTSQDQASTKQASPSAILTVEDNGVGLSEEDRAHLFDPFYSGRQAGRGLGFGLCKCWRIVETHRGRIEIVPRDSGGVRAVVEWPAPQAIR